MSAPRQPNAGNVWTETADVAITISDARLVADGIGGYKIVNASTGTAVAARMLADAYSGYSITAGATNPSALAELRLIDLTASFDTYT